MKIFGLFLAVVSLVVGYSNEAIDKIYQQASQIVKNNNSDKEDEELLFEFYFNEIAKLDFETLEKNPELVFRKDLAWFEVIGSLESVSKIKNQLDLLKNDLQFVIDHSDQRSRLFKAAQLKSDLVNSFLKTSLTKEEDLLGAFVLFNESFLRKWGTKGSTATGKNLREEVFSNVQNFPDIAALFFDYLILAEDDPDLVLGYIKPDLVKAVKVDVDEDGEVVLVCEIEYSTSGCKHKITTEF